jgi:uncharacterized membrane protein YGL010W
LGIPLIVISIAWLAIAWLASAPLAVPIALFAVGWTPQFVGRGFERKAPEFIHDRRFLSAGLRWWVAKIRGRVGVAAPTHD